MIELSREEARELAVAAQGLARPPCDAPTPEQVRATVRRLGCVQIDTIHIVARSQYLVLWSRLGGYDPAWLDEMLHPRHEVFEYWAHAASLIPTELYPYFIRRMKQYHDRYAQHEWVIGNPDVIEHVQQAVALHGPLDSTYFEAPKRDGPVEPWAWYGGKPTNQALDWLWMIGKLGIQRRINFQRVYDLPERIFSNGHDAEAPDPAEERRVLALRAALAMGVVLPRWLNDYYRTDWGVRGRSSPKPAEILAELASEGLLIPVMVDGLGEGFVLVENRDLLEAVCDGMRAEHTTLLSPFDNLIWDRKRTEELFDFEYRIEVYTPAPKRRYGYFTMPILHRGRLVGRVDPKADRKNRVLILRAIHLEPSAPPIRELIPDLRRAVRSFAAFNGCDTIQVEAGPAGLVRALSTKFKS